MIKALKVTMIVYAALGILCGLAFIFVPRQVGAIYGYEQGPAFVRGIIASLGISFISACIFLIIAARDPLKHILWVKYAIVGAILQLAGHIYSVILGHSNFRQVAIDLILHPIFAVLLLVFYPRRKAPIVEKVPSKSP